MPGAKIGLEHTCSTTEEREKLKIELEKSNRQSSYRKPHIGISLSLSRDEEEIT